jgi:hypothetical protein
MSAFRPDGYRFSRAAVAADFPFVDAEGNSRVMDLAVTGGNTGAINTVDLSDPYNPQVIGVGKDADGQQVFSVSSDITISPNAGLVFVTTFSSIQVFDVKDPYNPLLLLSVANLPDENGNMMPIGQTPGIVEKDGWVYLANMVDGMRVLDLDPVALKLYCDETEDGVSPNFCADFYPDLGAKKMLVYGVDTYNAPLQSPARLIIYDPTKFEKAGFDITKEAMFKDGYAELTIKKNANYKNSVSNDIHYITFQMTAKTRTDVVNNIEPLTLAIRNNANVELDEVIAGTAVYVASDVPSKTTVEKAADGSDKIVQRFDFVQELLNQVVPRKRSLQANKVKVTYQLIDERSGVFDSSPATVTATAPDTSTERALRLFRENFGMGNTSVAFTKDANGVVTYTPSSADGTVVGDNTSPVFRKISKQYDFSGYRDPARVADMKAKLSKIVDKNTLVGNEKRLYEGDISSSDYLINTPDGKVKDTGLYELHENVVKVLVSGMITEASLYADFVGKNWFPRDSSVKEKGVSYNFGGKQTLSQYSDTVATACGLASSTINSITLYYKDKDGAVKEEIGDKVISPAINDTYKSVDELNGCQTSNLTSNKKYPGLLLGEQISFMRGVGDYYKNENMTDEWPEYPQFNPSQWAGIDCSGLVQRAIMFGKKQILGGRVAVPAFSNTFSEFGMNIGSLSSSSFLEEERSYKFRDEKMIKRGDLISTSGHIAIVYSLKYNEFSHLMDLKIHLSDKNKYEVIHAYGIDKYKYDGVLEKFSRKVTITGGDYSSKSKTFGRLLVWD